MLEQSVLPLLSNFAERLIPLLEKELNRLESVEEHEGKDIKNILNMFCKLVATVARIAKLEFSGESGKDGGCPESVSRFQEEGVTPHKTHTRHPELFSVPREALGCHAELGSASQEARELPNETLKQVQGDSESDGYKPPKSRQQLRHEARELAKSLIKLPLPLYPEAQNYQARL